MTIAEYAKSRGVSKQSVYERVRRGTLPVEVIDGVKHIVESSDSKGLIETLDSSPVSKCDKRLEKTLKKLNKVKHKLELSVKDVQGMRLLLDAKNAEIDTLKKTFGLITVAIENKMLPAPSPDDAIEVTPVHNKKDKKKRKHKKKK